MPELVDTQAIAGATLAAAERELDSWLADAERPTLPDLVAFRQLLRSARVHVTVVTTS